MIENEDTPIFDEVEAYDSDKLGEEQSSASPKKRRKKDSDDSSPKKRGRPKKPKRAGYKVATFIERIQNFSKN